MILLLPEVTFGNKSAADLAENDWTDIVEPDDDEDATEADEDTIAMLGFDPFEEELISK